MNTNANINMPSAIAMDDSNNGSVKSFSDMCSSIHLQLNLVVLAIQMLEKLEAKALNARIVFDQAMLEEVPLQESNELWEMQQMYPGRQEFYLEGEAPAGKTDSAEGKRG
ncbi:hypothetical protein DFQ28_005229, partial [Apophysomyces sp. BC1034]